MYGLDNVVGEVRALQPKDGRAFVRDTVVKDRVGTVMIVASRGR
jgi:hypothetical protein